MNSRNLLAAMVRSSTRMPTMPTLVLVPRVTSRSCVMKACAAYMSKMLGMMGIITLSARETTSLKRQPPKPPGVSITTWVVPRGGLAVKTKSACNSQVEMGRTVSGRRSSHSLEDCCTSASPSMTAWPLDAKYPATLVDRVDLPAPPLGLAMTMMGISGQVPAFAASAMAQGLVEQSLT